MTNKNYHPVSMFTTVFEKLLFEQINNCMEDKFSKHLTGFQKNRSTQNSLLVMIEQWKATLNKRFKIGALFMDFSGALRYFRCLSDLGKIKSI